MKSIDDIYRDFPDGERDRQVAPESMGCVRRRSPIFSFVAGALLLAVIAGILPPIGLRALPSALQSTTEHLIAQLGEAAEAYQVDFGMYPPGDGTGTRPLVEALSRSGPKKQKDFEFPPDLLKDGSVVNAVRCETTIIHYLYPGLHRPGKFDLWAEDCHGNPAGINNW